MPLDSRLDDHHNCSQNWVMVARPLGYEIGMQPSVSNFLMIHVIYLDVEYSHSTVEGPLLPVLGWLHSLSSSMRNSWNHS